jgi:hypothetical protein
MPPVNPAQMQALYNAGKTLDASVQSTFTAYQAALQAQEQNNLALDAAGASSIAQWFRERAVLFARGFQILGNQPRVEVYANIPGLPQDPNLGPATVGAVTTTDAFKLFGLIP